VQNYKKSAKLRHSLAFFSYFCTIMKIFTSAQVHELDKYTIENEPIKSIDLMERAAKTLTQAITDNWGNTTPVVLFAGPGNNGGDALAVARMLIDKNYDVTAYLFNITGNLSEDCLVNKKRLIERRSKALIEVTQEFEPPQLGEGMLVVDGLFGSGLNKPLAGGFASLVKYINASPAQVVSIDVPSGLMTEDNTYNVRANIMRSDLTLTLQLP
jgi:NAD(P)H-hydrate epimerase